MLDLNNLLDFFNSLPDIYIYFLLGISAFLENVFPPLPGDTITACGAFLVGIGRLDFLGVYLSTTLGSLVGFMFLFWLGSFLGRRFFLERDYRFFKAQDIIRAEEWFRRHGHFLIAINRFLPGLRSVISIVGGILRLRTYTVTLLALISACLWNLIWMYFGYALGNNWEATRATIAFIMVRYNCAILTLLAGIVLVLVIRKIRKGRGRRAS